MIKELLGDAINFAKQHIYYLKLKKTLQVSNMRENLYFTIKKLHCKREIQSVSMGNL